LYISPLGCTGGSGQSYGSVTISGRIPNLHVVWKGSGEPSPNFLVSYAVVLGAGVVGLKLCISPMGYIGGRSYGSMGVEGHLVYSLCAKAEETPPLILGVQCGRF